MTRRVLELRKGTVDLVVNDLAPDVIWQLRAEGHLGVASAPGTDYPPAGLNRVHYSNPEVDRLIEAASSASGDERRALYARAQRLIAADVPYISLWYKTNVAVFQPDLEGVPLSPIADFLFLKDVHRSGAALPAGGAE